MFKILVLGDPLVTAEQLKKAVHSTFTEAVDVICVDWKPVSDEEFWHLRSVVEKNGPSAGKPPEEVYDLIGDVQLVITQHTPINQEMIARAKECVAIGICRAGVENIDIAAANEKNIAVFNTMGRNAHAVSDYTIGMMLSEMRNIARSHAELKQGTWKKQYSNAAFVGDMYGKTVGLVGFGYIGQLVAKKLQGFEVEVLAFDPYASEEIVRDFGARKVTLDELCKESDLISIHARLSEDTRGLIGEHEISLMKPTAYIINTARAGLIDENALVNALEKKQIGGAGLDVFWAEPPASDHPLMKLDNVTITPHLAGSTKDAFSRTPYLLLAEIKRTLAEGKPRWIVNQNEISLNFTNLK